MASAADLRKEHELGSRGRVSPKIIAQWDAAHPDDPYAPAPRRGESTTPDYPDDGFDALFDDAEIGAYSEPVSRGTGETPPSRPKSRGGGRRRSGGLRGLLGGKGSSSSSSKKPRVPVDDLIGMVWRSAAKFATPLPPLYRTLRVQAPVAGLLLEDAVKDTVVDAALQPFARLADVGKTASALLGPPLFVTGLSMHVMQAQANGEEPNPFIMTIGVEGLRSCLMTWMEVAGPKFDEALAREQEFEGKYGADVDRFIAWIMSPAPTTEAETDADEAFIRRATHAPDAAMM